MGLVRESLKFLVWASIMFFETLSFIFDDFINPSARLYWPVLISSVFLAWLVCFFKGGQKPWEEVKNKLLNISIWTHPSSTLDFKLFFLNNFIRFIFVVSFSGFLLSSHSLSVFCIKMLRESFGEIAPLSTNDFFIRFSYTLFSFILLDFLRFFQHYLMHRVPFLWRIHRVHHSAQVLTPLTLHRIHPIEMFIGMARSTLFLIISSSLYIYLFQVPLYGFDVLGVNLFGFLFNAFGSNLRHSHIWLGFGIFEYVFVSPAQHQIHHSKNHSHKNLGVCLSIWDICFNSFFKTRGKVELEFGLSPDSSPHLPLKWLRL